MSGQRKGYRALADMFIDHRDGERAVRDSGRRCGCCGAWVGERCIRCDGPPPWVEKKKTGRPKGSKQPHVVSADRLAVLTALASVGSALPIGTLTRLLTTADDATSLKRWKNVAYRLAAAGLLSRSTGSFKLTTAGRRELAKNGAVPA